jgi:prolyl-tRNA synthetase
MVEKSKNLEGINVGKSENFSEWYTQVVLKADLADYGPVQGTMAIRPTAYEIWEGIQEAFNKMIKETGHRNAYFPLLIPESFLTKEAEHFEGFTPEVFWVTHSGNGKLGEQLAIRPTSETIIYSFYSKWIRSWRDLPLLLNQWCNVLRAEIKATKPFLRTSEFLWQEGHTAHVTKEEADKEVRMILGYYKEIAEQYLAIPVLEGMKSDREKFAGALYTTTIEAMMPDGKAVQSGTSHNLGQHFAKAFGIEFLNEQGQKQFAWQTSWGISTRLLGALIMIHGDDKGLVVPPRVAPVQLVLVPIYKDQDKANVLEISRKIADELRKSGFRIYVDDRENRTPGWKFNEHETKGVPLRIEIGPKDIAAGTAVVARRDTAEKKSVKLSELNDFVKDELSRMQNEMFGKAKKFLDENIRIAHSYDEFKEIIGSKKGFIKAGWCGKDSCEDKIKEETGATIRLIPFEPEKAKDCIYCNESAKCYVYFALSY